MIVHNNIWFNQYCTMFFRTNVNLNITDQNKYKRSVKINLDFYIRDAPIIGIGRLSAVLPIIVIGRLLCQYRPIVIYYVL